MLTDSGHYLTLDTSRYQGDIDWDQVTAAMGGPGHVYLRVNDVSGEDPTWRREASEARDRGWHVGGYVFAFATQDPDAIMDTVQAAIAAVFGRPYTPLPVMVDVEDNRPSAGRLPRSTRLDRLDRLIRRCIAADPRLPPIYSAGWYWYGSRDSAGVAIVEPPWVGVGDYVAHPFFIAAYNFQRQDGTPLPGYEFLQTSTTPAEFAAWGSKLVPRWPAPMTPWSESTLWQFTSVAVVPGISAHVDMNLLDRAWADAMVGAPPPGPNPPPSSGEEDDMLIIDMDGTKWLCRGDTLTWINDDGARLALEAALPVKGTDQRYAIPFFIDPTPGFPTYPAVWQHDDGSPRFRFEPWMAPRGLKPVAGGGGVTAAQVEQIVKAAALDPVSLARLIASYVSPEVAAKAATALANVLATLVVTKTEALTLGQRT